MLNCLFRKSLVSAVMVLFIRASIQPAFAKNTIKTTISETLEDCRCQHISNHNLNRLEKLLKRAEIFTNVVAILFKKLHVSGKATMRISPPKEIDYYNLRSQ